MQSNIRFVPSTVDDIPQIQQWTDADVYHNGQHSPGWWITGNGFIAFRLEDNKGPVFYVRIDDGEYARLNVQFPPIDVVPKMRLARAMIQTLPRLIEITKSHGCKGLIFDSVSPALISFMEKLGFLKIAQDDSYLLLFGE